MRSPSCHIRRGTRPASRRTASVLRSIEEAVMEKKVVKMSSIAWAAVAIGMGTAPSARADARILTTVPFAFIAGDKALPSGNYVVKEISAGSGAVEIVSADGKQFATTLTVPVAYDSPSHTELVFEKFGNRYFLSH